MRLDVTRSADSRIIQRFQSENNDRVTLRCGIFKVRQKIYSVSDVRRIARKHS